MKKISMAWIVLLIGYCQNLLIKTET